MGQAQFLKLIDVDVSTVRPMKGQPRKHFDDAELQRLGQSLKVAQRQPIKVIEISDQAHRYELVDGERRWRAAKLAGIPQLSAIVVKITDARYQFTDSLISNFSRQDLSPLEKAEALLELKK